jgi:23S rRNA (cytidine1920-2'-O)/16S rRNA (cytidine1409-2'-O)-methyltransferase
VTRRERRYVSRGGEKLQRALEVLGVAVTGKVAADLGCHTGGFVDCLLQHGAAKVYAVDTGHNVLAWELRNDARVVLMERTNALHVELPEPVDIVTIDVGWTPQRLILPHALTLLRRGGLVISLLKPQYEAEPDELRGGVVRPEALEGVLTRAREAVAGLGARVEATVESPLRGSKGGNTEFFLLIVPEPRDVATST